MMPSKDFYMCNEQDMIPLVELLISLKKDYDFSISCIEKVTKTPSGNIDNFLKNKNEITYEQSTRISLVATSFKHACDQFFYNFK
ncbi:hypothetical protein psyc5s11_49500 [Clostridium gelidum]|uniref:Uncharacterized protein n=1 Tax=Clostridium gelidum TaxID=704125 RepID=A0ABM7TC55_9CLOT|nr:hypothetical protein [Clostridium gelidum]BCZ48883.1 hypothetical protein psyc5s11_49500 [Clostridium gelidum]